MTIQMTFDFLQYDWLTELIVLACDWVVESSLHYFDGLEKFVLRNDWQNE